MEDCIINFTPTGMVPQKGQVPTLPISVKEIVTEVLTACRMGITMVHLHARNPDGSPSSDPGIYGEIIAGIREREPELIICVSLSGRDVVDLDRRSAPLSLQGMLKPDLASLTMSSLNFSNQASLNAPETIQNLARMMQERGILPEVELFDLGMVNYFRFLVDKGWLHPPHYANILLGNIAGAQMDLAHAGMLIRDLPPGTIWSLGGIGRAQLPANTVALAMGGGVRVGLEDNIYEDSARTRIASNHSLLQRIHSLAALLGRSCMTPRTLRQHLLLAPGNGTYGRSPQA